MKNTLIALIAFLMGAAALYGLVYTGVIGVPKSDGHARGEPRGEKQLWTCGMHPQVIQDHPGDCPICHMKLVPLKTEPGADAHAGGGQASKAADDGATVTIDPAVIQNMGVRLATVVEAPLVRSVRMVGYLNEAQPNIQDINLRVSGWIRRLHVKTEGQAVKAGDPLFDLYSPELQAAVEEAIIARRAKASASGASATELAAQLYDGAVRKLELLGLARAQIEILAKMEKAPETVTFTSPIAGDVTQKPIVEGSEIKAGGMALEIVDHTTLWLDAQAFDMDLPLLKLGQPVAAAVASRPGQILAGTVVFIAPQVDPMTRTALVRMQIPNPNLDLKPGMYATMEVKAQLAAHAVLSPVEAVIDTGEKQVVFVAHAGGRFEPRKVRAGFTDDQGRVQILSGLKPGEEVVASGQFLIDSESRMKEAVQKFIRQREAAVAGPSAPPASAPAPVPMAAKPAKVDAKTTARMDALLTAYLGLSARLGAVEADKRPLDPAALVAAAHALHVALGQGPRMVQAMRVAEAAEQLRGKNLDAQRESFKPLSAAVIELTQMLPPSNPVGATLYRMHCPMAKADWLQAGGTPANPYYATDMKDCAQPVTTPGEGKPK